MHKQIFRKIRLKIRLILDKVFEFDKLITLTPPAPSLDRAGRFVYER